MHEGIGDIIQLLNNGRIKEALTQLQAIGSQTAQWDIQSQIESASTAYGYMLQYAAQGMEDPTRKDYYRQTLRTAYQLTDMVNVALLARKTSGVYYDRIRTFALHPSKTYAELQLMLESFTEDIGTASLLYTDKARLQKEADRIHHSHEEALTDLFDKTWATPVWNDVEASEATSLLASVLVSANDLAVMVSATTLAILRVFDIRKFHFLLNAYQHENPQVSQRAFVGIVITILKYTKRISLYPETLSRLSLLTEDNNFCQNLYTIQMQLLITRETSKIDKKMREEIIPEMMKNAKQLNDPKFRFEDVEDPVESNPEWEEWIDKSGISDKIREMGEWQMAGADVYMSSFAQLKHYPFFHRMAHWFYPFDSQQPELASLRKDFEGNRLTPLKLITQSDYFCNSDKYSFCLAMLGIPEAMKEASVHQMEEQVRMNEEQKDKFEALIQKKTDATGISRQYIQDLYRFFKLWRHHSEEEDIFQWKFDLWENTLLANALLQEKHTRELANYLLQKNYLEEACTLYEKLLDEGTTEAEIYQKAGYIRQKQKKYAEAIRLYQQADLFASDNLWTNQHLAQCYKLMGDQAQALTYYRKVEAVQPENLNIALQIGQCLTRLENYAEALAYFYKVEYLEKNPNNARRAIAWCSFLTGKYEESLKYYKQLTSDPSVKAEDWMNAGHVFRVCGNMQEAIKHYQKAHEFFPNHSEFIRMFLKDQAVLQAQGISSEDIHIQLDLLI